MKLTPISVEYHRNGVAGTGFHVVLFRWTGAGNTTPSRQRRMLATVFPAKGCVAVLDVDETAEGDIGYANRWRGDDFEAALRHIIMSQESAAI